MSVFTLLSCSSRQRGSYSTKFAPSRRQVPTMRYNARGYFYIQLPCVKGGYLCAPDLGFSRNLILVTTPVKSLSDLSASNLRSTCLSTDLDMHVMSLAPSPEPYSLNSDRSMVLATCAQWSWMVRHARHVNSHITPQNCSSLENCPQVSNIRRRNNEGRVLIRD